MSGDTRRRPAARDLHRYRGLPVYLLFLAAVCATPLSPQPAPSDAARMAQIVRDAGRSLAAGNAASFLFYFDRERFADYSALESDVDALTRHIVFDEAVHHAPSQDSTDPLADAARGFHPNAPYRRERP